MTENEAVLLVAAGEIEINFNLVESDEMPSTPVLQIKRSL